MYNKNRKKEGRGNNTCMSQQNWVSNKNELYPVKVKRCVVSHTRTPEKITKKLMKNLFKTMKQFHSKICT